MRKNLAYLVLLAFIYTACAAPSSNVPVSTQKDSNQQTPALISSTKETKTPTPKQTATALSPIDTATAIPPTEVPFPVLTKDGIANFDWDTSWGETISKEKLFELANKAPAQFIKIEGVRPLKLQNRVTELGDYGGEYIGILGKWGGNIFPQYAVEVDIDGELFHVMLFKAIIQGTDGNNQLVNLLLCFDPLDPGAVDYVQNNIRRMMYRSGAEFSISLKEKYTESRPIVYYNVLNGDDPARQELLDEKITENISTTMLWALQIIPVSPGP